MEFLSIDLEKLDFNTSGRENEIIDMSKLDFQPTGIDYAYYKKRYPLLDDEVIDKLVELYNCAFILRTCDFFLCLCLCLCLLL